MICWFEAGVTDSFGPRLEGMRDGLGFLPGSALSALRRRGAAPPRLCEDVAGGFPAGLALDDAAAARYEYIKHAEVVSTAAGSRGYLVGPGGEEPLEVRQL